MWLAIRGTGSGDPSRPSRGPRPGSSSHPVVQPAPAARARLRYHNVLRAGSHDQLRALIDPIGGIEVRVAWASEEDIGEQEERYTATSSNQDLDGFFFVGTPDFIFYFYNSISCPDAFDDTGAATCHVFAGGFSGKYVWRKVGARAYLIRIEEQSH